jgi:hypothetical protein
MKSLFRILNVPGDTQMRAILDPLDPDLLRPLFHDVSNVTKLQSEQLTHGAVPIPIRHGENFCSRTANRH